MSDVIIADDGSVWIDGAKVTKVSDFRLEYDAAQPKPRLILEFMPDSIIYGEVPDAMVDALVADRDPDGVGVNINRAIAKARARQANGGSLLRPAPPAATASTPARVRAKSSRSYNDEAAYPVAEG